jgi:hypothetical protein
MLAAVIVLALLTVLVATDPGPSDAASSASKTDAAATRPRSMTSRASEILVTRQFSPRP